MGLGKTLQMISLIVSNSSSEETGASLGPTLIVCPLAVMQNWEAQVEEHVAPRALTILKYHGTDRNKDPHAIAEFDIVITTYDVVRRESDKEVGLHIVEWLRVVLDEGHIIRNHTTKMWKACHHLQAERRWALSGTPVQNKLDDLFSLLAFLRMHPWENYHIWKMHILSRVKAGGKHNQGIEWVKQILGSCCMRRTKSSTDKAGKKILNLPEKYEPLLIHVPWDKASRKRYDQLTIQYQQRVREMEMEGSLMSNYTSVLSMLLRKRQCCAHVALLPPASEMGNKKPEVDKESMLDSGECIICDKIATDAVIAKCSCRSIFCEICIESELREEGAVYTCPICEDEITKRMP